jgi:hypothetical protein
VSGAEALIKRIQSVLTPDLLKPEYRSLNARNPMYGHCYAATEALYYLLQRAPDASRYASFKPHRAKDDQGVTHWWLEDYAGVRLDPTADQYLQGGRRPPYESGRRCGFLSQKASNRAVAIMRRVGNL